MITASKKLKPKRLTPRINLEALARDALERHNHFRGRSDGFDLEQRDGVLIVRGNVPSFYLKKSMRSALRPVESVGRIDDRVDVVCSHGLSSVRETERGAPTPTLLL